MSSKNSMTVKLVSAAIAVALLLAFLFPMVFKLGDAALAVAILVGVVLMLVDLAYSLLGKDE